MNCKIGKLATLCAAFALVFVFVSTASAQVFTGRIDVTIEDTTGGRLPGVSVDLSGPTTQSQVSDAQGEAHFLNLPVGIYTIKATLSGFNPFTNNTVQVATGSATPIAIKLSVAGTSETVNVTAATPIIDVKRETTTTNVTLEELQNIPTARDPWVVMQTVPTIYVDRVNVGGSESGQQSNYLGKGTTTAQNTWNIDGVPITDMGAAGSTPTYYAFRHVPGDVGHDRRRRRVESDARRAVEHGAQEGLQHAARQRQHLLREREPAGDEHSRRSRCDARRHRQERQPHR